MSAPAVEMLDGRQSRTARSRSAICEACLDLIQEGELQPSADQVAARAGVSRRSIFNHFSDLAALYDAVVEAGNLRCAPLLEVISDREPIALRVEHLVRVRSKFLEATAPFARALTAQSMVGTAADQARRVSKEGFERQADDIKRLFQRELAGLPAPARAEIVEGVCAATGPLLWEHLRRLSGLSMVRARGVMKRMLTSILRDAGIDA